MIHIQRFSSLHDRRMLWQLGDTVGGAGRIINPESGKATHAVIWLHGLGDQNDGWATAMKGLCPVVRLQPYKNKHKLLT